MTTMLFDAAHDQACVATLDMPVIPTVGSHIIVWPHAEWAELHPGRPDRPVTCKVTMVEYNATEPDILVDLTVDVESI